MKHIKGFKFSIILVIFFCLSQVGISLASSLHQSNPVITHQIFEKAKLNNNWKLAFLTTNNAQVVFMNVSPITNPSNEIGMETHKFDQIIFVVEGNGKAVLNGKSTIVKSGDMIFIPESVEHNVINLGLNKPLKILSIYSATDIPANAIYKKKSDTPKE